MTKLIYRPKSFAIADKRVPDALDKIPNPRELGAEEAMKVVKKFLGNMNYTSYVDRLAELMKDPKFAAVANMVGSGKYADDLFEVKQIDIPVRRLMPTQSEIDLDKSLKRGLGGGVKVFFNSPVILGVPLLTLNGNYIIDGHHRWSQVLCFNPNATMTCINLESQLGPIATLKSAQLAIAGTQGKINVSKVDGYSMYNISEKDLRKYIDSNLTDNCIEELGEFVKSVKDRKSAVKYILTNAMELKINNTPVASAPKRDFMPQTDNNTAKAMDKGSVQL